EDKDEQQWFLESTAFFCYAVIISGHGRRLYEEVLNRRLGKGGRSTALIYAYSTINPDEAFPQFQATYRKLAEIYQDQELQDACLAFSEADDVWKRHTEVIKLAKKYRNKELQRALLFAISVCCSESIA